MIIGIGIDIVEIERIKKVFEKRGARFTEKIFTKHELEYSGKFIDPFTHLAARFSAKEAYYKCIGEGVLYFNEIEVLNETNGKPFIRLYGKTLEKWNKIGSPQILISLTHTNYTASAVVILELK